MPDLRLVQNSALVLNAVWAGRWLTFDGIRV